MPNPKGKSIYHLCTNTHDYKKFNAKYPKLLRIFLEKSIHLAVENKMFFEQVFFSDLVIKEVKDD